jgi:hypothetical protein
MMFHMCNVLINYNSTCGIKFAVYFWKIKNYVSEKNYNKETHTATKPIYCFMGSGGAQNRNALGRLVLKQ